MERLQKILSAMGITSRRKAEDLIREGRVTVNGRVAQIGDQADPAHDHIKVDGKRLVPQAQKIYILINKPRGTVTTTADPEGRSTVMDLLKKKKPRIFPVGRLDFDAEGLLLLTNDGKMAYRLSHPSFGVARTYHVKVKGNPLAAVIQKLSGGIYLEDGPTAPCHIRPLRPTAENFWMEMAMHEGKNRQVKRMWEKVGHPVLKLKRISFAGLSLGRLAPGQYRSLRPEEVEKLRQLTEGHGFKQDRGSARKDVKFKGSRIWGSNSRKKGTGDTPA